MPPPSAVRLCLTANSLNRTGGYASNVRRSLKRIKGMPERRSLSALRGGIATEPVAKILQWCATLSSLPYTKILISIFNPEVTDNV